MKKILIFVLVFALNGCAYMQSGDTQTINLKTSDNKRVKAQVQSAGSTKEYMLPTKVKVKKSQHDIVVTTIATECIIPTTTVIPSKVDEWVWANVANLGVGLVKDLEGAGSMMTSIQ